MKHKNFSKIYAYTYLLTHVESGVKYYGVRHANLRLNLTPLQDFGIKYFSSGCFSKEFRNYPERFTFRLHYTFDTPEEAKQYEHNILQRKYLRSDWANKAVSNLRIAYDEDVRQKMKDSYIGKDTTIRGKKSAITRQTTIVDEQGTTLAELGSRKAAITMQTTLNDDGITLEQARIQSGHKTKLLIGNDGLNEYQRTGIKSSETKRLVGDDGLTVGERSSVVLSEKLHSMSTEDFEMYLSRYKTRYQSTLRTRLKRYRESLDKGD